MSTPIAGQLGVLKVRDGDVIKASTLLAVLDRSAAKTELKEADDRTASARSSLSDARTGSKTQEVSAAQDRLARAEASARSDQISALEANLEAAKAALSTLHSRLAQMELKAPANPEIERVLRAVGEPTGPGAPVIRFLAEGERKPA